MGALRGNKVNETSQPCESVLCVGGWGRVWHAAVECTQLVGGGGGSGAQRGLAVGWQGRHRNPET